MNKLTQKGAILLTGIAALLISTTAPATTKLVEGFDTMSLPAPANTDLTAAGWLGYVNLFSGGIKVDEYSAGGAPNDSAYDGVSRLVCGYDAGGDPACQGGEPQGPVVLSVFSNYPSNFYTGDDPLVDHDSYELETNFYKEFTVDAAAAAAGETWRLSFDAKKGNLELSSTAQAFIKILDSVGATYTEVIPTVTVDMTSISTDWMRYTVDITLTTATAGQLLQIGFSNNATGGEGSGIFYDNLCFNELVGGVQDCTPETGGGITAWTDDFQGYVNTDSTTLEPYYNVFGNVDLDSTPGVVDYGYGADAPNNCGVPCGGTPAAFSALEPGEGAGGLTDVALSVYSDYANDDAHANNLGTVEANFLKEYTVGAGNVGETWTFAYDAKLGLLTAPTTASAFIKVLCSQDIPACGGDGAPGGAEADYSVLGVDSLVMTATPAIWTGYTLSLPITAAMEGMLFQIGMNSTARNFNPSSIFYDNLNLSSAVVGCVGNGTDTDGDSIDDNCDNCSAVLNADQTDADGDGHGNICDADFDQSCVVNVSDLGLFKLAFFGTDPVIDMNSDGVVNVADLGLFKLAFFGTPGPSGADIVPAPFCNP